MSGDCDNFDPLGGDREAARARPPDEGFCANEHPGNARDSLPDATFGAMSSFVTSRVDSAYSWWIAAVTLLMASIGFGAATVVPILLRPIAADLGQSTAAVASVHASVLAGAGISGLVIGRLHDRFGFFPLALIAAGCIGSGLCLAAWATDLGRLYLAFGLLVGACGQGVFFTALSAAVSQWFVRYRALSLSIAASGQGLGGLLVPPWMRWFAAEHGWRNTLFVLGVASGCVLLACSCAFRRPAPVITEGGAGCAASMRPASPRLMSLGLCLALSNLATFMVIGHLTAAAEEMGIPVVRAAALVSMLLGASLASRLVAPLLFRRWGSLLTVLLLSLIHVAGLLLLAATHGHYAGTAVSAAVVGVGFGAYLPGYAVIVREQTVAAQAGRRIAEIYFFGFMAGAMGTWAGGWVRDASGTYATTLWCAATLALTGLVALTWLSRAAALPSRV
ncbi:MFS transporter [Hydrogenophaga sp.]|uniref:MFS transporter n=1 Tax=Hydrogenophaga sp. TaxID=1904254 RepID=UPI002BD5677D|nr:MFS transporter [Hydrogenophaga sp.]HMP09499.1 MFS transporter [Hydrogenophaga sp.]